MRILIIGGTGFIGPHVIRALGAYEVTVISRGLKDLDGLKASQWLRMDRLSLRDHRARIAELRLDVVLDMIPQNGPDALAVTAAVTGIAGRLVAISSGSVYRGFGRLVGSEPGPVDNTPCSENAPLRERCFPYRRVERRSTDDPRRWLDDYDKIPAEVVVLSQPELPANVVRLPLVYGPRDPDDRITRYLERMRSGCKEIVLGESAATWRNSRAYVENVGDAIARVVLKGQPGRIYNVSESNHFSEAEWIRQIGVQDGWDGVVRCVPNDSTPERPCVNELPRDANFAHHLILNDSLIRRELGYQEVVPFEEGLRRTISHPIVS